MLGRTLSERERRRDRDSRLVDKWRMQNAAYHTCIIQYTSSNYYCLVILLVFAHCSAFKHLCGGYEALHKGYETCGEGICNTNALLRYLSDPIIRYLTVKIIIYIDDRIKLNMAVTLAKFLTFSITCVLVLGFSLPCLTLGRLTKPVNWFLAYIKLA